MKYKTKHFTFGNDAHIYARPSGSLGLKVVALSLSADMPPGSHVYNKQAVAELIVELEAAVEAVKDGVVVRKTEHKTNNNARFKLGCCGKFLRLELHGSSISYKFGHITGHKLIDRLRTEVLDRMKRSD